MKRILLIVLSGLLLTAALSAKPHKGPVMSGQVVDTDGRPVVGAVVTDGFTQSITDNEGKFHLNSPRPERVRFVSVRIPSDYLPVLKNGVPTFFSEVPKYEGRERTAKITLVKRTAKADDFKMLIIADPQAHVYDPAAKRDNTGYCATDVWLDMFEDMRLKTASDPGCYYGMCMGDIAALGPRTTSAEPSVYPLYCQETAALGFPFFNVVGNHDHLVAAENDDDSVRMFENFFGPRNYSFDLGQIHCVVVDDCIFVKGLRRYPLLYGLEDEFLTWLKGDLALVPKDMPVMVFTHANPFNATGVNSMIHDGMETAYKLDEFLAALQGFDKLYVWCGHTHTYTFIGRVESPANPSGIETFIVGRSVGPFGHTNEHVNGDGSPRGYVVMEVSGKDISWKYHLQEVEKAPFKGKDKPEYKWKLTRTDESVQLRAYPRGSYDDDFIYANVFLWDKHWQIPVLRIGDNTYPMIKDDCYDLSYKEMLSAYKSAGLPQKYSGHRDHTFLVRVPDEARGTGTVEVTDRFGRTWTTDVSVDPVQYEDGLLHLTFDFRKQPEGCPEIKETNISFTAPAGGTSYSFSLSCGRYVSPTDRSREGHVAIADRGNSLMLPAIEGRKLVKVTVHPDGNKEKSQQAEICSLAGSAISGGEKLAFFGNATDSWILSGTQENTPYRIVCRSNAFRMGEIRLTYE